MFLATPASYTGQVATRSHICAQGGWNPAGNFGISSRSAHWARETIASLQLVYWNGYVNAPGTGGTETATGATLAIRTSIEYPAGTFTQVKWATAAAGSIASGAIGVSDATTVAIPQGAQFWVQTYQLNANGCLYFGTNASSAIGDRFAFNGSDVTMTGAITDANPGYTFMPAAIVGATRKRSFLLIGTSRTRGVSDSADSSGDLGTIARSIGPYRAYINAGIPSDTAAGFLVSRTARMALSAYVSDVVVDYGVNDNQGTIQADEAAIFALFPTKRVHAATQSAFSTGAWTLANGSDQTTAANQSAHRAWLLTRPSPLSTVFDVNSATQLAGNENKWKAAYTADGVHENQAAALAIQSSGAIPSAF